MKSISLFPDSGKVVAWSFLPSQETTPAGPCLLSSARSPKILNSLEVPGADSGPVDDDPNQTTRGVSVCHSVRLSSN